MYKNGPNTAGYEIKSPSQLTAAQTDQIITMLERPEVMISQSLSGRSHALHTELSGLGPVVIKSYRRGGMLQTFIRQHYLSWGRNRAQAELETLIRVADLNVNVPQPIAAISKGKLLYRCWLVTKEIEGAISLAELAKRDPERAGECLKLACQQVAILIKNAVLHVDLHPGNVLVDRTGKIFLVDFDKARSFTGRLNQLRDIYLCRWRRAVIKHSLPDSLIEYMSLGLRMSFEHTP